MKNTKKSLRIMAALVAVWMLMGGAALAESGDGFSAKGTISKPTLTTLAAPMGGQVQDFAWAPGDMAQAGALAFGLTPTQIYAANDGVIVSLHAKVGDQAASVQAQYGALCYIEREDVRHLISSTSSAYNNVENRDLRVGDTVQARSGTGSKAPKGTGTVISMDGRSFVVEIATGDFELEKSVSLYFADSEDYKDKELVGKGTVHRPEPLAVVGDGIIAQVLVKEGDKVKRGQPLFILDSATAQYNNGKVRPEVRFSKNVLISEVLVRPGQFVGQGQAVMTVWRLGALEAALEVDELDIAKVEVGQRVRVTVDAYPDQERTGTVTEIKPLGVTVLDTTKFVVKVAFEEAADLMIGMHVTGYWD